MIYDKFILEKLTEIIPLKSKEDLMMLSKLNQDDENSDANKKLNFIQQSLTVLNKLRKQFNQDETRLILSNIKQNLLSKNSQVNTIYLIYSLYKNVKEQNFQFDKIIDDKMAEIELGISMTSLEIQIEELLKTKIDFHQLNINTIDTIKEEKEDMKEISKIRQELGGLMKIIAEQNEKIALMKSKMENDTIELKAINARLLEERKELLKKIKDNLRDKDTQQEKFGTIINDLNNKIKTIDKDNIELKEENKKLKEEIASIKTRLKIIEDINKIPDSD